MPTYRAVRASLTDDVATLVLGSVSGLRAGLSVDVAGIGHPYDGTYELDSVDATTLEITYAKNHANVPEAEIVGQLTLPITWADTADVEEFLGVAPATAGDEAWLESATAAANDYAYDRRRAAGYADLPDVVPSSRVRAGVVLKAAELYKSRGSVDGFQSFNELEPVVPVQTAGEIARLLGIGRPAVA